MSSETRVVVAVELLHKVGREAPTLMFLAKNWMIMLESQDILDSVYCALVSQMTEKRENARPEGLKGGLEGARANVPF